MECRYCLDPNSIIQPDTCCKGCTRLVLTEDVEYIGKSENPKDDPYFQAWKKALIEVYGREEDL